MTAWLVFIKERFPLMVYLSLSLGIAISAFSLSGSSEGINGALFATFGGMLFFFTLRVMDEYKDYHKDLIAHPLRPLPRGLIPYERVHKVIYYLIASMFIFALVVGLLFGFSSLFLYWFITIYLYLMFREFYIGDALAKYPLLYAFTHQIILFPIILFAFSLFNTEIWLLENVLFASIVFCAFFTYEICRKLDPDAPAILGTYWVVSGRFPTLIALFLLMFLNIIFSAHLFQQWHFLPVIFLVLGSLLLFLRQKKFFKLVELTASISLLVHIWSVGLWRLFS